MEHHNRWAWEKRRQNDNRNCTGKKIIKETKHGKEMRADIITMRKLMKIVSDTGEKNYEDNCTTKYK